jgi:hypothetical protein
MVERMKAMMMQCGLGILMRIALLAPICVSLSTVLGGEPSSLRLVSDEPLVSIY